MLQRSKQRKKKSKKAHMNSTFKKKNYKNMVVYEQTFNIMLQNSA